MVRPDPRSTPEQVYKINTYLQHNTSDTGAQKYYIDIDMIFYIWKTHQYCIIDTDIDR